MPTKLHMRFPDRTESIEALLKKNVTFREICSDYEEACVCLDDYCRSEGLLSKKCDRYRELIGELEGEIIEALREAGF